MMMIVKKNGRERKELAFVITEETRETIMDIRNDATLAEANLQDHKTLPPSDERQITNIG